MKHFSLPLLLTTLFQLATSAQVPDSTFGVPTSFEGITGTYWPAVTGCDFEGREDRCVASMFLENGKILLAGYSHGLEGTDFALVRLLKDGQFDTLAGPEGQIRIDLGYQQDSCLAATLYDTDRVLMGGCVTPPGIY